MLVREVAVAHASCFSPWLDAVRALVISVFSSPFAFRVFCPSFRSLLRRAFSAFFCPQGTLLKTEKARFRPLLKNLV